MSFGNNLKKTRRSMGLSQVELATKVGITERSIYNYESGDRVPRISTVDRIADALNVTADYLLNGGGPQDNFLEQVREEFGPQAHAEAQNLLDRTTAMFAGGALDQDAKDAFFESITQAYFLAKKRAREKAAGETAEKDSKL